MLNFIKKLMSLLYLLFGIFFGLILSKKNKIYSDWNENDINKWLKCIYITKNIRKEILNDYDSIKDLYIDLDDNEEDIETYFIDEDNESIDYTLYKQFKKNLMYLITNNKLQTECKGIFNDDDSNNNNYKSNKYNDNDNSDNDNRDNDYSNNNDDSNNNNINDVEKDSKYNYNSERKDDNTINNRQNK